MDNRITLSFAPQVLDYIAKTLAQRPYAEVAGVLGDIQQQINQQQQPAPQPQPVQQPVVNGQDGQPRMEAMQ